MEKYEHGGQIYDAKGKSGDWLDFSANINPLGLSEKIFQALKENLRGIVNYPDPNFTELKQKIAKRYEVSEKNLVLLNGAAEFFYLYLNTTRPERVIIPVPSFSEYERAARAANCEIIYFFTSAEENFALDVEKIRKKIKSPSDCVIIGRPNNPTGNLIATEKILWLSQFANVLIDESFIDFLEIESLKKFSSKKITVVQSLTKIFAIPGLRLGFAVVEENLAQKLNLSKDVWALIPRSARALQERHRAALHLPAALSDEDFLLKTRVWLAEEQKFFVERLKNLPKVKIFSPTVNFVLFQHEKAEEILQKLRGEKILLRSCKNFVGLDGSYLRSAIRLRKENIFLLNVLEKCF